MKNLFWLITLLIVFACNEANDPEVIGGCWEPGLPPKDSATVFNPVNSFACNHILIDASHDGGVWWYPMSTGFNAEKYHQGKQFADYLRSKGFKVDVLPRNEQITSTLLANYAIVIRSGGFGRYSDTEIDAYKDRVKKGVTLLLLGEHMQNSPSDKLAENLGITFSGSFSGNLDKLAEHSITRGVSGHNYIAGAAVSTTENSFVPLGWVSGNLAMGVYQSEYSRVFVLGDVNGLQQVPQPLTDNLISWFGSECNY